MAVSDSHELAQRGGQRRTRGTPAGHKPTERNYLPMGGALPSRLTERPALAALELALAEVSGEGIYAAESATVQAAR